MELPEKLKERIEASITEIEGYHGCYSGDCPHYNFKECLRELQKSGAVWSAKELWSEIVELREALEKASWHLRFHSQGKGLQDFQMLNEDADKADKALTKHREKWE